MPEDAICTENVVIPRLSSGSSFKDEWLEYSLEYLVQHLSVWLPLLIEPLLRNIPVVDQNRQVCDHCNAAHLRHLVHLQR